MLESLIDLDRRLLLFMNGSSSLYLDEVVYILTTAATWIPLYLGLFYLVIKNSDNARKICFIVVCAGLCYLFAGAIDDGLVKPLVGRWRPTHDPILGWQVDVVDGYRGGRFGFFSAHASNTFSIAVFFSLLVRSRLLTVTLVLWSFINCWTRLYLGVHFPGDILVGLFWGGLVGLLVYLFYNWVEKHYIGKRVLISSQYSPTGYLLSDVDIVISIFVFTLVYTLLRSCLII